MNGSKRSWLIGGAMGLGAGLTLQLITTCLRAEPEPIPIELVNDPVAVVEPPAPTILSARAVASPDVSPQRPAPTARTPRPTAPRPAPKSWKRARDLPPRPGAILERVTPNLKADPKVRRLIALQESLDQLHFSVQTLGRLRPSLTSSRVQRLAIETTASFLRLSRPVAFHADAVETLREVRQRTEAAEREGERILQESPDPRAALKALRRRYRAEVPDAGRRLERHLDRSDPRHRAFLDQLAGWAEHVNAVVHTDI